MKIIVTQSDIDSGICGSPSCCPIAQAIKREMPGVMPHVALKTIFIYEPVSNAYRMPVNAAEFVWLFDNEQHVEPFEFEATLIR